VRARLTTIAAGLALLVSTALLSGCGATLDPVAQAATRTTDASTLRFSMQMTMSVAGEAPVSLTAKVAIDGAAKRMQMTMDFSKLSSGRLGRLTMIEDATDMYIGGDGLADVLPAGKRWAKVDLRQMSARMGLDLSALMSGQSDPRTSLAQLRDAGEVVRVGPETIDGIDTTRYSVFLHLRDGLDRLEGPARDAMKTIVDRLEAEGHGVLPADAWVDGAGYLRRLRLDFPGFAGTGSTFAMTMDLSAFGEAFTVPLPAAAEVADVTGTLGG